MSTEITDYDKLNFFTSLIYFGSYDLYTLLARGKSVGDSPSEVGETISDYLKNSGYTLEQVIEGIDLIAVYNAEVLSKANSDFEDKTGYSLENDGECYFFSNYSDCPFQCKDEEVVKEEVIQAMVENDIYYDDLNIYSQFILSELNISEYEIEEVREKQSSDEVEDEE